MKAEQLRKSILQLAIQGKLVKQDPNDEPASVLLERIRAEKQCLIKEGKIKKDKGDSIIFKGDDNCHYEKIGSEVKNIEDEIDFDLPDGWEYIRLCTVCWLDDVKKSVGETLPYLDAKTLRGKTNLTYLTEGKIIDIDTKVILVDGENSGEVFDVPFKGYMGSTFKILGASKYFNLQYLNIILDFYKDVFRGNKIGAAIPHLNKNLFKSLIIGLPPIREQERIVEEIKRFSPVLAEYDKLENQATKLDSEIYDKLKKSILQYAIQGKLVEQDETDEPASVLLERIRAEKKAQLGKKYVESYIYKGDDNCYYEKVGKNEPILVEDLPFDIPDTWMWARLGYIGDWGAGATPARGNPEYYNGNIPWIKTGELNNSYVFSSEETITLKALNECSLRYNKKGDVLIAMYGATIGKLAIAGIDLTTNQACCACTPHSGINNLYLFYLLMAEKDRFVKMGAGGAQPNISREKIVTHIVPIPPYSEQLKIVNAIKYILKHIEKDEI